MDISALSSTGLNSVQAMLDKGTAMTKMQDNSEGNLFSGLLNSAIDNITTTNSYISDAENEKMKFALGEVENSHDSVIAMQKASQALSYTVAVRDKFMEAYREIMQMQI